ncbi:Protein CASP [Tupaia chinensis]|uniref:Protein CASP n=1 Tax=Tupaia chinensis TaxID=246437 RepID=L9K4U5_TUPCH|nr:Protein CASP [Tupaia chinensis]
MATSPSHTGRCAELQVHITEAMATATEQRELIARLEQDLSTIQSIQRPDAEGAAEHLEKIPEPIKEATALFYGPSALASGPLPEGHVDSLLSIISSQRERFRARNQELEAEGRLAQHTIQALQSELDSLRADNIKLFEKIKFLQSYPGRGGGSDDTELRYSSQYEERLDPFSSFSKRVREPGQGGACAAGSAQEAQGSLRPLLTGLGTHYQPPFIPHSPCPVCSPKANPAASSSAHSGPHQTRDKGSFPTSLVPWRPRALPRAPAGGYLRERQRKYLSLSPWDKATLSMGRLVLSNKMARTIGFFYTLFLHCLVFLVLYKLAWSESMERDCTAFCAKKFADHLHKFHENDNGMAAGDLWQ